MLELRNVVGGYGKMTVLNGTSFKIEKGTLTTVIGPNGAGKSTVFKAIFGRLKIRSGTVILNGQDVTNLRPANMLARGVTYVPQGRNLFPMLSVRHNLEMGGITFPDKKEIRVRMERVMDQFPTLREKADVQAITLSGGQQKQLEIARALLLEPMLILIDEPSIGLSPQMISETFRTLRQLCEQGTTVLMVEQNAKSALMISDYGLVLEQGQTRMHDRAGKLLNDPRVGRLFLGSHMEEQTEGHKHA